MSITTSTEEREQAVEKLAGKTDEQLREDLAFWAVAVADHNDRWTELTNERLQVGELYTEAQAWVGLATAELQRRQRRRSMS